MPRKLNISGNRFGRLVAVACLGRRGCEMLWKCKCDCGSEYTTGLRNLRRSSCQSCGCLQKQLASVIVTRRSLKHGEARRGKIAGEYKSWSSMLQRCTNKRNRRWADYGGRGISVCHKWKTFEAFLADMGHKPSPLHSLDRINNDKGYCPGNCRWATAEQQASNKRPYPSGELWLANNGHRIRNERGVFVAGAVRDAVKVVHE